MLVVDDHPLMTGAIAVALADLVPAIRVLPAGDLGDALKQLSQDEFDLVILDLSLPDTVAFEGLKRLRSRHPDVPVVVCSGRVDYRTVCQALELGAIGFIPKSFGRESFAEAFRTILSGNVYLPSIDGLSFRRAVAVPGLPLAVESVEAIELSPRQLDVLRLLVRGYSNKLICRHLDLAEGTVKVHVSAVLSKLGARTRAEAIIAVSHLDLGSSFAPESNGAPAARSVEAAAPRLPTDQGVPRAV